MTNTVIAYHFLSSDGTANGGYRPAPVGEWEPEIPDPVLCQRGYHGSVRVLDALKYATGPILQRCEYRGVVHGDDKLVAVSRRALCRANATALLRIFAVRCAEEALSRLAKPDPRSLAACEVASRHALGQATDRELAAAWTAAWAAAWTAAWTAAGDAARAAAGAAAGAAAWDAARDAAGDAAWAAAWDAARDAAWAAAGAAAWDAQNSWLESACLDLDWCGVPRE